MGRCTSPWPVSTSCGGWSWTRAASAPTPGAGARGIVDGQQASAQLAQPNGVTSDGVRLYFADSETSAVRTSDFDPTGSVGTIVGEDLFTFGDRDGFGDDVRLQHVQGIEFKDGAL